VWKSRNPYAGLIAMILLAAVAVTNRVGTTTPTTRPPAPAAQTSARTPAAQPAATGGGSAWLVVLCVGGLVGGGALALVFMLKQAEAGKAPALALPASDRVRTPESVAARVRETEALLAALAATERFLLPEALREWVTTRFYQVQEAREGRDAESLRGVVSDELLARHRAEAKQLRAAGQINRMADLEVERAELVHAAYGGAAGSHEFSALLTYQAISYRIDERTRQPLHGCQERRTYQEFWTFRRGEEGWLLAEIRPSRDGSLLTRPNTVTAVPAEKTEDKRPDLWEDGGDGIQLPPPAAT
jgi:predicted lipid-binding transport protein (Tim44 family)